MMMVPSNPSPMKKRLRWFRFSLRTMLLVVVVFAVWLGVQTNRARRQREAVAAILQLKGTVIYDYQQVSPSRLLFNSKAQPRAPAWLRQLVGDEYFQEVAVVHFGYPEVTDADLEHLAGMTRGSATVGWRT